MSFWKIFFMRLLGAGGIFTGVLLIILSIFLDLFHAPDILTKILLILGVVVVIFAKTARVKIIINGRKQIDFNYRNKNKWW